MGKRDLAIDFVRGACFPIMLVDYLRNHWLSHITFRALGFFCAATVFIFLSGYVAGTGYSPYLTQPSRQPLYHRVWRRAALIYAIHILVTALAILAVQSSPDLVNLFGREVEVPASSPWEAFLSAFLLMPCAPLLDILPLYVFFLILTPLALRLFGAGRHLFVAIPSLALWTLAQMGYSLPLPPYTGAFDTSSWQLLYFFALYLGFRQSSQPLERPHPPKLVTLALFGAIVMFFLVRHADTFGLARFEDLIPAWTVDKIHLGPLTFLNLMLWVVFLWLVPRPLEKLVNQGRLFIALGRNSLPVFAWLTILFYIFMSLFPQLNTFSLLGQALVVSFAVSCLIFPIALSAHRLVRDSEMPARRRIDEILALFQPIS